jgi:hypothetical protein
LAFTLAAIDEGADTCFDLARLFGPLDRLPFFD